MMTIEEQAAALLLRSPNLSVSDVMELLDLGDQEFRDIAARCTAVARLLEARRQGRLPEAAARHSAVRVCLTCDEEFLPYAGAKYCSDTCARLALLPGRYRQKLPSRDR